MRGVFFILFLFLLLQGCFKPKKADLVIFNAKIHTLDEINSEYQAMAIRNGKIIEFGPERQILNKYRSKADYDAEGHDIYPGFTDAHTHLLLYAQEKLAADLSSVHSMEKMIHILEKYRDRNSFPFIIGRGITLASEKERKETEMVLNKTFPDIPVYLITHDAHTAIVNRKGLDFLSQKSKVDLSDGILKEDQFFKLYTYFPSYSYTSIKEKLFEIQDELLQFGITEVHEMGWSKKEYQLFRKLTQDPNWKIHISAYLLPSPENIDLLKRGKFKTEKLQIQGLKLFLDGTFGSESAAMIHPYKNQTNGMLNYSDAQLDSLLRFAYRHRLQIAVHAAGDRASEQFLRRIDQLKLNVSNLQWRMEHLQKVNSKIINEITQFHLVPSVQPYHAVRDIQWLENHLSVDSTFYAYQSLYQCNGIIAIGSDLPIEKFNPFYIIWAATQQKGADNPKIKGLYPREKLTITQVLQSYTLFNAQLVGRERSVGTLKIGKEATFFSSNFPIDESYTSTSNYALKTFIKGKEVYSIE